ncbi:hypothetical protein [Mycobacterium sp. NAZ190054]|uniref:hypothetical protein n=1 Tax=Mycobacterium sp. NAZ190054 TaxID=1747766 RepID=UPI000798CB4F|nr:hypothetical protein [Mycobacterium sp. NAZ190054]KWX68141.1 hypothetical protein ASJ79_18930 [Mycobacterium sp. NAZ190054]
MVFCKAVPILAASVTGLVAAGVVGTGGTAVAQPPLHHIRYTVGAAQDITNAEIYYREKDPPNWAEYSHNPYLFTPNVEANLGPNKPWVFETWLADPAQWSMVVVGLPTTQTPELAPPGFVCELRVDDVVVATDSGLRGALCSQRPW